MAPMIFVAIIVLAGAASSAPIYSVPVTYVALSPVPENIYNQVQDTKTGEYAFGYAGGPVAREEARTADGVIRGAYSYLDAHGVVQHYQYVADDDGFRVAGTNIPMENASSRQTSLENAETAEKPEVASSRKKRSAVEVHPSVPVIAEGVYAVPTAPLIFTGAPSVPTATSSQSRVQIHKSSEIEIHAPIEKIPVTVLPAVPVATKAAELLVVPAAVPLATSSQSRYQVHQSLKTEINSGHPVETVDAVVALPIETKKIEAVAAVAPVSASLPLATSSQSRFQIHDGAKTKIHEIVQPVAAPIGVETIALSPAIPLVETVKAATSSQTRFQIHNSARLELDAGNKVVDLEPLKALHPQVYVSSPLIARHPVGVGLGVVPSPFVAYNTYGTTLLAEA